MNKRTISTIQSIIAIGAIAYVICPDLLFGPLDDAAVAAIATIADVVLGVVKSRITASPVTFMDEDF